jgi:hypothetical protein
MPEGSAMPEVILLVVDDDPPIRRADRHAVESDVSRVPSRRVRLEAGFVPPPLASDRIEQ